MEKSYSCNQQEKVGSRARQGPEQEPRGWSLLARTVGDERTASTRHRVLAHLEALNSAGIDVALEMQTVHRWSFLRPLVRLQELLRDVSKRPAADLILTHRRTYPPNFARRLSRLATPMVFDCDDALYLPPPSFEGGAGQRARYQRNFDATCTAANLVLCGNSELARNVPHDRTEVVPTAIDCRRFNPSAITPATGPVIGWVGYSDNLPYLEALADPLRELARRHPQLRLLVVADRPPQIEGVRVEFRPWSLATEVSCFDDMAVGVMPLDDTPWTRAKCSFKLLQYMALGIPAVASPVGMNLEVVADGQNGVLAETPKEWLDALDRLLGDEDLRRRFGAEGRQSVAERYSLEVISPRLIDLLVGVFRRYHGSGRLRQPVLP